MTELQKAWEKYDCTAGSFLGHRYDEGTVGAALRDHFTEFNPEEHLPAMGWEVSPIYEYEWNFRGFSLHLMVTGKHEIWHNGATHYCGRIPTLGFARELFSALGIGGKDD